MGAFVVNSKLQRPLIWIWKASNRSLADTFHAAEFALGLTHWLGASHYEALEATLGPCPCKGKIGAQCTGHAMSWRFRCTVANDRESQIGRLETRLHEPVTTHRRNAPNHNSLKRPQIETGSTETAKVQWKRPKEQPQHMHWLQFHKSPHACC